MLLILAVLLAGGIFGGIVNFLLARPDDVPTPSVWRSMIVGLAASLLVPLFLNMISSNLLDLIRGGDGSKLLILLGFCLVAAISSTAFIRTLSDKVLTEAKQAREQAQQARAEVASMEQDIRPIVVKDTETDPESFSTAAADAQGDLRSARADAGAPLAPEQRSLLNALSSGRWTLRTEAGLARELGIDRTQAARLLDDLAANGYAGRRVDENGTRWFATELGRTMLARASA